MFSKVKRKKNSSNHIKEIIKGSLSHTPFCPVHIGKYIRKKYFFKYLQMLPITTFHEVLDAGCGSGEFAIKLAVTYPQLKVTGYDVKELASWNKSPKNIQIRQQDLLKLSEENYYDFCLCIDVLEHIHGNHRVLENIYRSLKHDGYFYLHMPARRQQRLFPRKYFKKFEKWAEKEHIGEQYTLEEMKSILKYIGFTIVEAHSTFGFWGKLAWELDRITDKKITFKILLTPLLRAFSHFELCFPPKYTGNGILVVGKKSSCDERVKWQG